MYLSWSQVYSNERRARECQQATASLVLTIVMEKYSAFRVRLLLFQY